MRSAPGSDDLSRPVAIFWLLGIALLSFALRLLGFDRVLMEDGEVVLQVGDALYHARRALYSFVNFPSILEWDPYLNYPRGSTTGWPPLFDLSSAAVARLFGDDPDTLEKVLAWTPPVLGSCATLLVYRVARRVASRRVGLGAAALNALVPASVYVSAIGNADHHAAVALLAGLLLMSLLAVVDPSATERRMWLCGLGLTLARTAMLLTWNGSLLYLGLTEGLLLATAAFTGRRSLYAVEAGSAAATALLAAPVIAAAPTPAGGALSSAELSWLHVASLGAAAAVAALLWLLEGLRPAPGALSRCLRLVGVSAGVATGLALVPAVREALAPAFAFVMVADRVAPFIQENRPLFGIFGRNTAGPPERWFAWLAYLVPICPLAPLIAARDPARRVNALVLAAWTSLLAILTVTQIRYAADFAVPGSVALALLLAQICAPARSLLPGALAGPVVSRWGPVLLALVLLWPSLERTRVLGEQSLAALRSASSGTSRALKSPSGSLALFARAVREVTPETAGFFDPQKQPEYGILCGGNIGHAIRYYARRPVTADGFWHYLDPDNFAQVGAFYESVDEDAALAVAERLRSRYVVTSATMGGDPSSLAERLHRHDGNRSGPAPRVERFRLVMEGPRGGSTLQGLLGGPHRGYRSPYKLFEIVEGAVLRVPGAPGAAVRAAAVVSTSSGRRFRYVASGVVGDEGFADLRVPYATGSTLPARSEAPYTVVSGDTRWPVVVPEAAVRGGWTIPVGSQAGNEPR